MASQQGRLEFWARGGGIKVFRGLLGLNISESISALIQLLACACETFHVLPMQG